MSSGTSASISSSALSGDDKTRSALPSFQGCRRVNLFNGSPWFNSVGRRRPSKSHSLCHIKRTSVIALFDHKGKRAVPYKWIFFCVARGKYCERPSRSKALRPPTVRFEPRLSWMKKTKPCQLGFVPHLVYTPGAMVAICSLFTRLSMACRLKPCCISHCLVAIPSSGRSRLTSFLRVVFVAMVYFNC